MGLGSGIRKKPIPDPGVKKTPDPGSATLVRAHICWLWFPDVGCEDAATDAAGQDCLQAHRPSQHHRKVGGSRLQ